MRTLAALCVLASLSACDSGLITDAQPIVSVLKQDGDCFALMTPGSPVAPTLGVAGTCNYRAEPSLLAGVDRIEVIVDYGPDVTFDGQATAPSPKVTVSVDGVASAIPVEVSSEYRVGARAYFIATFTAPIERSSDVRVTAGVNAGFQTIVPVVFSTIPPPLGLRMIDCITGTGCELHGAVGSAHLELTLPGRVPQVVRIHSTVDGLPLPDPVAPVETTVAEDRTFAIVEVPVPAATPFATWTLSADLDDGPLVSVTATILEPDLTAELTCGASCALGPDQPVGVEILAPSLITPLRAIVDTRFKGVPQLVGAVVELVPRADGHAVGLLGLRTPTSTGTWQVDVSVAWYTIPTIVTTIQ